VGVSSLAFAIGLYLPVTTTSPLILGGLIAWWQNRKQTTSSEPATLFTSGLIAGDALMGIGIAGLVVSGLDRHLALRSPANAGLLESLCTIAPFALVAWMLVRTITRTRERA
jgi:hypothetical protein